MALSSEDTDIDTDTWLLDKSEGEEGEGKMNGKSSMDTYTLTYVNRWPMGIYWGTQNGAL